MSRVGEWIGASCQLSDRIHRMNPDLVALRGLTDVHDTGELHYMREWGTPDGRPVLRDHRDVDPDGTDTCEHWIWRQGTA